MGGCQGQVLAAAFGGSRRGVSTTQLCQRAAGAPLVARELGGGWAASQPPATAAYLLPAVWIGSAAVLDPRRASAGARSSPGDFTTTCPCSPCCAGTPGSWRSFFTAHNELGHASGTTSHSWLRGRPPWQCVVSLAVVWLPAAAPLLVPAATLKALQMGWRLQPRRVKRREWDSALKGGGEGYMEKGDSVAAGKRSEEARGDRRETCSGAGRVHTDQGCIVGCFMHSFSGGWADDAA